MRNNELIKYLSEFITQNRFKKFNDVLKNRTNYITVVLEDLFQSHNASAALRTCDCLGIQDVYVIENKNIFKPNSEITMGASNWVSIHKNSLNSTLQDLKQKGYRLVATLPNQKSTSIYDFDITKGKFALFFGTEKTGLSKQIIENADEFVYIPMYGFTESFNISVSVSIIISSFIEKLKNTNIKWQLSNKEKNEILLNWLKYSIKSSDKIIERYKKSGKKA